MLLRGRGARTSRGAYGLGNGSESPWSDDKNDCFRGTDCNHRNGCTVPANATPGFAPTLGAAVPLDDPDPGLPTNPSDPRCVAMPEVAQCQGGPYAAGGAPTGPADTACISQPANPVCAGGPYVLPPAAPPIAAPLPVAPPPMAPPPMEPSAMPVAPAAPADPGVGMAGGMPGHI
jgi:hypothetical protein